MVEQETPSEQNEDPVEDLEPREDESESVQGGRGRAHEPIEIVKRIDKASP